MPAKLFVDLDRCDLCGACCFWLPDLLYNLRGGCLLISGANADKHAAEIGSAMTVCKKKAIYLDYGK